MLNKKQFIVIVTLFVLFCFPLQALAVVNSTGYAWSENFGWIRFDHAQTGSIPATTWSSNAAPAIGTGPSDGSSSSTTPTNAGANVTFTVTATDGQSDNYYLAICKTDAITAVNNAAPTCTGGNWCISGSTASASQATCNSLTSSASAESNVWYAFVCDYNSGSLCSASSQGTGEAMASPSQ